MEIDQYHELEIKEIFTRTNNLSTTRLRLFSFFGSLDLTVIGFAIKSENESGLLLILGACCLILLLVLDSFIKKLMYALYARGLILEQKYCPEKFKGTVYALTKAALMKSEFNQLNGLLGKSPQEEDIIQLLKNCFSSRFGILLPLIVMIIQVLVGIGLI